MIEKELTQYLVDKYRPAGIILFGSRAAEDFNSKSDWDLFIFTDVDEGDVADYAEYNGWNDEFLEVTLFPTEVADDFILDTATHPVRDIKVLYDNSGGVIDRIVQRTMETYEKGPPPLTPRKRALYRKILTKYIRKCEARGDQPEVVFFAASQFFISAVRYWFEVREMWPHPIHEAMSIIQEKDAPFADELKKLYSKDSSPEKMIGAMKQIRWLLFAS